MSKKVVILRGPSGCGKTHNFHQVIAKDDPDAVICSADMFFIDEESGDYVFSSFHLSEAHSYCLTRFLLAMREGKKTIVVDNTHIRKWEYINYVRIAEQHGDYRIYIVQWIPKTVDDIKLCNERQVHDLTLSQSGMQALQFEPATRLDPDLQSVSIWTPQIRKSGASHGIMCEETDIE